MNNANTRTKKQTTWDKAKKAQTIFPTEAKAQWEFYKKKNFFFYTDLDTVLEVDSDRVARDAGLKLKVEQYHTDVEKHFLT